jgi:hypothetical protein
MYYLGTITGTSGAASNAWTGPSGGVASGVGFFNIPPSVKSLYLVSSASGVLAELSVATGISFQTTAARGAQIDGPGMIVGPLRCGVGGQGNPTVVSIFNPGLGTVSVRVYAAPTT